jgi:hypothetical protein
LSTETHGDLRSLRNPHIYILHIYIQKIIQVPGRILQAVIIDIIGHTLLAILLYPPAIKYGPIADDDVGNLGIYCTKKLELKWYTQNNHPVISLAVYPV